MKQRITLLATSCALVLSSVVPSYTLAASIQMLPPIQSGGTTQVCASGQSNKLLSWDGENSIKCQANVTVTSDGYVSIGSSVAGGYLSIGATDAAHEGAEIHLAGSPGHDTWYQDVYDNVLRFFTQSTNATQVQIFNHGTGVAGLYVEGNVGIAGAPISTVPLNINGPIRATSGATVAGWGCSPEGQMAYDMSNHAPVYCAQNGIWTKVGGSGPQLVSSVHSVPGYSTVAIPGAHIFCSMLYPGGYSWGRAQRTAGAGTNSFGSPLYQWIGESSGTNPVMVVCLDQQ